MLPKYLLFLFFALWIYSVRSQYTTSSTTRYLYPSNGFEESVLSTLISSSVDDATNDLRYQVTINFGSRRCLKPRMTVKVENIDNDLSSENITIYKDFLFTTSIAECGTHQSQCSDSSTYHYDECLTGYTSFGVGDFGQTLQIGILKPKTVGAFCTTPTTRSLQVNLTFVCGTTYQHDATQTIDLPTYDITNPPSSGYRYHYNQVDSNIGSGQWAVYDSTFTFNGGYCYEPRLSFKFKEHDFNSASEWYEIYTPNTYYYNNITRCPGGEDLFADCATMTYDYCLSNRALYTNEFNPYSTISIFILKPPGVNMYCGATINATVTLRCRLNSFEVNRTVDTTGTNQYQTSTKYILPAVQGSVYYGLETQYDVNIKFINGGCYNPRLTVTYSQIDYDSAYSEWIAIFASIYSGTSLFTSSRNMSRCSGGYADCRTSTCIINKDTGYPTKYLDAFHVGIWQGYGVGTSPCSNSLSLDVEITIECGGAPRTTYDKTKAFDLTGTTLHDIVLYTIPIQEIAADSDDSYFYLTYNFLNGEGCYNPLLTVKFADIDYDQPLSSEYLHLYYPTSTNYLAPCNGISLGSCAVLTCTDGYDLGFTSSVITTVTIGIAKGYGVNPQSACDGLGIDVNSTIQCGGKPTMHPTSDPTRSPTPAPTSNPTPAPTTHPTPSPTNNPTIPPTTDPTADPTATRAPSSDPTTDPTKDPTIDPTKYPSDTPTFQPTATPRYWICDESCYKDDDEDDRDQINIDVKFWFPSWISYDLSNMECFLYEIFVTFFKNFDFANEFQVCDIKIVTIGGGGKRIIDNSLCEFPPCLINTATTRRRVLLAYNDGNMSMSVISSDSNTYTAVNGLSFSSMEIDFENEFSESFDGLIIDVELDSEQQETATTKAALDTENEGGFLDFSSNSTILLVIIFASILLLIFCMGCFIWYRKKKNHEREMKTKMDKLESQIASMTNTSEPVLQTNTTLPPGTDLRGEPPKQRRLSDSLDPKKNNKSLLNVSSNVFQAVGQMSPSVSDPNNDGKDFTIPQNNQNAAGGQQVQMVPVPYSAQQLMNQVMPPQPVVDTVSNEGAMTEPAITAGGDTDEDNPEMAAIYAGGVTGGDDQYEYYYEEYDEEHPENVAMKSVAPKDLPNLPDEAAEEHNYAD